MRSDPAETETVYDWRRDGWLAACALTAIMLIVSAGMPHAPGFDTFLRLFVFCLALVRGFVGFRSGGAWLPLSAAVIALLFNPASPVQMSATAWMWTDLAAAAWFGIVGAWRLLRSWDPQRGWAAAALSLVAVGVPAVAAFGTTDHEGLNPAMLNESLAAMNADSNASAPVARSAEPVPAPEPSRPAAHASASAERSPPAHASTDVPVLNAPAFDDAPAQDTTIAAPPPDESAGNETEGNFD